MSDWMLDWIWVWMLDLDGCGSLLDGMLDLDGFASLWNWMLDLDGFGSRSNFDWKQESRGRQIFGQAVRRQNRLT